MDLDSTEKLWKSAKKIDLDSYQSILSTLDFTAMVPHQIIAFDLTVLVSAGHRFRCHSCQNPSPEGCACRDLTHMRWVWCLGRQMLRWKDDVLHLSRPADSRPDLLSTLQEFFPHIVWESETDAEQPPRRSVEDIGNVDDYAFLAPPDVSVCSIDLNLKQTTFGWLHKTMHAPDNFLYLVIKPKNLPPST